MPISSDISNLVVVKCPECGLRLSFKAVPNYREKPITCPKCHHSDIVGHFTMVQDPAQIQGNNPTSASSDDDETRTVPTYGAVIKCLETGEERPLKPGPNTIGRAAHVPKASVLFTDKEQYMSRLHATLTFLTTGQLPQLQLRDEDSANGTFVSDVAIPRKSIVKLNSGTPFKMGKLTFVCNIVDTRTGAPVGAGAADDDSSDTIM